MTTARRTKVGDRLLDHDRALGPIRVAGCDETGRGALAGPIVVAAVTFDVASLRGPRVAPLRRLNDSKRLSEQERIALVDAIYDVAETVSVQLASPETIDRDGLHVTNLRLMRDAVSCAPRLPDLALFDGYDPDLTAPGVESHRVVKGDATSAAIAAASIIAKVARDNMMSELDDVTDGIWQFRDHVGYATPLHHELVVEHGPSRFHRMSFDWAAYRGEPRGTDN